MDSGRDRQPDKYPRGTTPRETTQAFPRGTEMKLLLPEDAGNFRGATGREEKEDSMRELSEEAHLPGETEEERPYTSQGKEDVGHDLQLATMSPGVAETGKEAPQSQNQPERCGDPDKVTFP
ncbi:hypothetical protein NDU88_007295 [Pleurodeles waltl]|uniref:Uncharacterized protein n=1 Tax=Pleurodeles waltl TaxID=8319 RepID=A0AAV7U0U6_PLEWA|nr:hypothetical protein NDU88_007295 [Pleurodeles waltl]